MIFSKNKNALIIYFLSAIFPFAMHAFYAAQHIIKQDQDYTEIGICILTCVMVVVGFLFKYKMSIN